MERLHAFLLYFIMQLYKFLLVLIISCSCYVSNAVGNTKKLLITNQKEFDTFIENLSKYPTEFTDTIELRTDIDVASLNSTTRNFYGYLKGNNHKIKNLKYPLFSNVYGVIDSLVIDESGYIRLAYAIGTICSSNYGIIKNCINNAEISFYSVNSEKGAVIGGICASNNGNIINCKNLGTINATYAYDINNAISTGGITGYNSGSIIYCENQGKIIASSSYISITGGICGNLQGGKILGSSNRGAITSTVKYPSVSSCIQETGGIVGRSQVNSLINRCYNYGEISNNGQYVGGIAAKVSKTNLFNLINNGNVTSTLAEGYSCASGIVAEINNVDKKMQFFNCINHGHISSKAKYAIATAAGICATIKNSFIANMYSDGSVSAQRVGGTATAAFEIPLFEKDSNSTLLSSVTSLDDANEFIDSYKETSESLLKWAKIDSKMDFVKNFFTYAIPQHGCVDIYVFDNIKNEYNCVLSDAQGNRISTVVSKSPIHIAKLLPAQEYQYTVEDNSVEYVEASNFVTQTPNIEFSLVETAYDRITFKQNCDAKGVDNTSATLRVYSKSLNESHNFPIDSLGLITAFNLEEDSSYVANVAYKLNGCEFVSNDISIKTLPIAAELSLNSATPYSLSLKCDNFEDIRTYQPKVFISNVTKYEFGGSKQETNKYYKIDDDGMITIDSLLYNYAPDLLLSYIFKGKERFRKIENTNFKTSKWGGEGIIQLSPKAAMIHALFGGMGGQVDNGGFSSKYDRARFYFRNSLDSDSKSESYTDGICIDNEYDYAVTIPLSSEMYQYYISLQYSSYRDPKNNARNGSWNIIDARKANNNEVEPRFFGIQYANNTLACSIIKGEKDIQKKWLKYKIEGFESSNEIALSSKNYSERVSHKFSSLVSELSYLFQFKVQNNDGKIFNSPTYRLKNNQIEITELGDDAFTTGINLVVSSKYNISVANKSIVIDNCNPTILKRLYDVTGSIIYNGYADRINVNKTGLFILRIGNDTFKIMIQN